MVGVGTIAAAMSALGPKSVFRLILLGFHLPDSRGFTGLLALQHLDLAIPIVIVSAQDDAALVEAAKALGAWGFLSKRLTIDEIARRLRNVLGGGTSFPANGEAQVPNTVAAMHARIAELSRAQRAVLIALADGPSNKEIARDLAVTEATVKAHLTAIFRKLGVANRTQALIALGPVFQAGESGTSSRRNRRASGECGKN